MALVARGQVDMFGTLDDRSIRRAAQRVADSFEREFRQRDLLGRMFDDRSVRDLRVKMHGLWAGIGAVAGAAFASSFLASAIPKMLAAFPVAAPLMARTFSQDFLREVDKRLTEGGMHVSGSFLDDLSRRINSGLPREFEKVGRKASNSFWKELTTPSPEFLKFLRTGIPAILASPIGIAALSVGAMFVTSFIGAVVTAFATAGLGAVIVAAAVAGLIAMDKKVKEAADRWLKTLKGVFGRAIKPIAAPLITAFGLFEQSLKRLEPTLTKVFDALGPAVVPLAEGMIGFVEEFLKVLTADPKTLKDVAAALAEMGRQLPGLGKSLGEFFKTLAENKDNIENIKTSFTILNNTIRVLGISFSWLASQFRDLVDLWNETTQDLREEWDREWNSIVTTVKSAVQAIREEWDIWQGRARAVFQAVLLAVQFVSHGISVAFNFMVEAARRAADWVQQQWDRVVDFFRGLPGRIAGLLASAASAAFWGGVGIINALIGGITSRQGALGSAVAQAAAQAARVGASVIAGRVPGFAHGGRTPVNEPFWVGERGPELMSFNRPGVVTSHEKSMRMVNQESAGKNVNVTQYITTAEIDPRVVAAKLAWELANRI